MIARCGLAARLPAARPPAELAGAARPLRRRQGRRDPDTATRRRTRHLSRSGARPRWVADPRRSPSLPAPEAPLILAGGQTQAALEVAVQVAVIGEPRLGGGRGDRFAGFDQAAGGPDTVRE